VFFCRSGGREPAGKLPSFTWQLFISSRLRLEMDEPRSFVYAAPNWVSFFAVASYGARTALDRQAVKGGKNADLALQVVAFSHRGKLCLQGVKRLE